MYVKAFDYDTIPDTETLSLTYLPSRVHWPAMTADRAKPNQLPIASPLCHVHLTKFTRSFCQPINQSTNSK